MFTSAVLHHVVAYNSKSLRGCHTCKMLACHALPWACMRLVMKSWNCLLNKAITEQRACSTHRDDNRSRASRHASLIKADMVGPMLQCCHCPVFHISDRFCNETASRSLDGNFCSCYSTWTAESGTWEASKKDANIWMLRQPQPQPASLFCAQKCSSLPARRIDSLLEQHTRQAAVRPDCMVTRSLKEKVQ